MYCSSCGIAVSPSSGYCNRCGVELNAKQSTPSGASQESLVWALVSVTVVGIGAVIGLMAVMKQVVHFENPLIVAFSLLIFLAFLGVDGVIIWLLLPPYRDATEAYETRQKELNTRDLAESNVPAVPEPA